MNEDNNEAPSSDEPKLPTEYAPYLLGYIQSLEPHLQDFEIDAIMRQEVGEIADYRAKVLAAMEIIKVRGWLDDLHPTDQEVQRTAIMMVGLGDQASEESLPEFLRQYLVGHRACQEINERLDQERADRDSGVG